MKVKKFNNLKFGDKVITKKSFMPDFIGVVIAREEYNTMLIIRDTSYDAIVAKFGLEKLKQRICMGISISPSDDHPDLFVGWDDWLVVSPKDIKLYNKVAK